VRLQLDRYGFQLVKDDADDWHRDFWGEQAIWLLPDDDERALSCEYGPWERLFRIVMNLFLTGFPCCFSTPTGVLYCSD
jgi:hypothetical protein